MEWKKVDIEDYELSLKGINGPILSVFRTREGAKWKWDVSQNGGVISSGRCETEQEAKSRAILEARWITETRMSELDRVLSALKVMEPTP